MSEGTAGEGTHTNGEGQTVDVSEVMKRLEQLEGSYKRVLEESKSHKSKAQEYKSKLDEMERKGIGEDVTKQLEFERKAREDREKENKKLKTSILSQRVREKVGKYAKDVHDLDDFLNQPTFSHILKAGIDEDRLEVDENAAKDYANKVLEAKPWLKKNTQQAGVDTTRPNTNNLGPKSLKNLSDAELDRLIYGE
jgi:hypothetical protein